MKALVCGLGSAGRRHVRNLKAIDPAIAIAALRRPGAEPLPAGVERFVDHVFDVLDDALAWSPDVAVIATPAPLHVPQSLALARCGAHVLVEKPLSHTLDGVDALIDTCRARALVLMVAYNLRFEPSLRALHQAMVEGRVGRAVAFRAEVGQFLPDWRPSADYRQGVSARRGLGGGVLLELSHEIDYACWLMGEVAGVSARVAHVSDLDLDVEDLAEITLDFASGAIGNIHLDMIQRSPTRVCRVIGTEGTLVWDGIRRETRCFSARSREWTTLFSEAAPDPNASYVAEVEHFLACVARHEGPEVGGAEARRALEIALAARRSSGAAVERVRPTTV